MKISSVINNYIKYCQKNLQNAYATYIFPKVYGIPYKKAVIPYLDHIAPEAEAVGAVNTIVRRADGLWGYNTDYQGFLYAARRAGISFDGKKVLVLGSGGASAASVFVARSRARPHTGL